MPFSLKMSKDIYQMHMDQIIEQCPGAICIQDDIMVYWKTLNEYNKTS